MSTKVWRRSLVNGVPTWVEVTHDHDAAYSSISHNHDGVYEKQSQIVISSSQPGSPVEGMLWFKTV